MRNPGVASHQLCDLDRSLYLSELHSLQVKGVPFKGVGGSMGLHYKLHAAVPST